MTAEDRVAFAEAMYLLGETFNEPVSDIRTEAYFDALCDRTLADVNIAVRAALRSCKFFPKPVELRELIDGSTADNAEVSWGAVLREVRRVGYYGVPNIDARQMRAVRELWGSWQRLCETLPGEGPELLGWAKQFKAVYQATERIDESKQLTSDTMNPRVLDFIRGEQKRLRAGS
jgi:hypothetical protein